MKGKVTILMTRAQAESAERVLKNAGFLHAAKACRVGLLLADPDQPHVRRLCDGADEGRLDRMIEDAEALATPR